MTDAGKTKIERQQKKYALVIIDGAADYPVKALGDKTPLQVACKPELDKLTAGGRYGSVLTVPPGFSPGSDVAIMSLLGYNPAGFYTGRAPLEAAARQLSVREDEWVFRCNLVTIEKGIMKDHSAGNIPTAEAEKLIALLNGQKKNYPVRFYSGVSYRNLMFYQGDLDVTTTPPHDILDKPAREYLPRGKGAEALLALINQSQELFRTHRPSATETGALKANSIWLWGQGKSPRLGSFQAKYGIRGAVITAVDLVRGIGNLIGWDIIDVPGATAYFDTNYQGKGEAAVGALQSHDLICVHIEAPDEAGHEGKHHEKVRAIEQIDKHIIGPLVKHMAQSYAAGGWRMLVMPDHPTPCALRTHVAEAVPFCLAGSDIVPGGLAPFIEPSVLQEQIACLYAARRESAPHAAPIRVEQGHELMDLFIKGNP